MGTPEKSKWCCQPVAGCPWVPCGAVCACALAGPGFVCFPPNWLVFPCPAHQTACFSSHLASPPGLEPPACTRPAGGPRERRGRPSTPLAWPEQGGRGRTLPAPALLRHRSLTRLLLPGIQGPWPVPVSSRGLPQYPQPLDSQMLPAASHWLLFPDKQG